MCIVFRKPFSYAGETGPKCQSRSGKTLSHENTHSHSTIKQDPREKRESGSGIENIAFFRKLILNVNCGAEDSQPRATERQQAS